MTGVSLRSRLAFLAVMLLAAALFDRTGGGQVRASHPVTERHFEFDVSLFGAKAHLVTNVVHAFAR